MSIEEITFKLILHGGNARSNAMEAIQFAKSGEFEKAKEALNQAKNELLQAHQIQTSLIQNEAAGNKTEISLLLVHAQDHLMNAMTIKDLAEYIVDLYVK